MGKQLQGRQRVLTDLKGCLKSNQILLYLETSQSET